MISKRIATYDLYKDKLLTNCHSNNMPFNKFLKDYKKKGRL